ncbi:hypothetical protein ACEPAF_882 [Sanghuangporus sanghuang]
MVAFNALASLLVGVSAVLASPAARTLPIPGDCNITSAKPDLPSGQTNITVPSGQVPEKITLGVGVQNYTCTDAGTYTSAGAVATLFDISCIYDTSQYSTITKVAYDIWNAIPNNEISNVVETFVKKAFPVFADHYFITSPSGTGISPVFDARATSHKGDPNAFILAARTGDLAAPTGNQDIDWLQLSNVQGDLAKTVLRIDTQRGQPPSSCTPGSELISVKYTAAYWFLN